MISFNTFTGELHGAATFDDVDDTEMDVGTNELSDNGGALASNESSSEDASSDVSTGPQSADSTNDQYDLFHERCGSKTNGCDNSATAAQANKPTRRKSRHSKRGSPGGSELSQLEAGRPPPIIVKPVENQAQEGRQQQGGRVLQLFHLLTFKNQAGDAKSALIQKLIAVTNVKELVMSKATQDQIASAANDAITDEILATVDLEDKRRQSISSQLVSNDMNADLSEEARILALNQGGSNAIVTAGHYSPYRVLELVDVLDSTTGGMVKLILTNVRQRAPFSQRSGKNKAIEFCSFCSAYSDHTATQHRCRICGVAGQHRSKSCPKSGSSPSAYTPPPRSKTPDSMAGKSYCAFCSSWVKHSTTNHQCRNCGALGVHRSRNCTNKKVASRGSSRWVGSPIEQFRERKFCDLCGAWRHHTSNEHKCSICAVIGEHRSKNCPMKPVASKSGSTGNRTPRINNGSPAVALQYCSFCSKQVAHSSEEHRCRVCRAVGSHRSGDCPDRKLSHTVLSYSVETASKVFEKVMPSSATALVWDSIDKVGDVDTILKKTLQRIGVWGGGSQTPITTPYAPPVGFKSSTENNQIQGSAPVFVANAAGVYVLSYAEGRSVVPERILKYMRLLMHHEISVNAFSVVVRFDPRSSHWELQKPGMVTPRSLPSSPTMSEQLKKRMAKYTLQTLMGTREKLLALVALQRKHELLILQQQQQQQLQALTTENVNVESNEITEAILV